MHSDVAGSRPGAPGPRGYGEPADIAAQFVDGMEGKGPERTMLPGSHGYLKTSTTLKHFTANNTENTRLTGSSNMDERTLGEYYTQQSRDIIQQSGPPRS